MEAVTGHGKWKVISRQNRLNVLSHAFTAIYEVVQNVLKYEFQMEIVTVVLVERVKL